MNDRRFEGMYGLNDLFKVIRLVRGNVKIRILEFWFL